MVSNINRKKEKGRKDKAEKNKVENLNHALNQWKKGNITNKQLLKEISPEGFNEIWRKIREEDIEASSKKEKKNLNKKRKTEEGVIEKPKGKFVKKVLKQDIPKEKQEEILNFIRKQRGEDLETMRNTIYQKTIERRMEGSKEQKKEEKGKSWEEKARLMSFLPKEERGGKKVSEMSEGEMIEKYRKKEDEIEQNLKKRADWLQEEGYIDEDKYKILTKVGSPKERAKWIEEVEEEEEIAKKH